MICLTPVVYWWWWFHRLWLVSVKGIPVLQRWHLQCIRIHKDMNKMCSIWWRESTQVFFFHTRIFLLFRMLELSISWTQGHWNFAGMQQVLIVKVVPFISKVEAHSWNLGRWNFSTGSVWNISRHLQMSTCLDNNSLMDLTFVAYESWNKNTELRRELTNTRQ